MNIRFLKVMVPNPGTSSSPRNSLSQTHNTVIFTMKKKVLLTTVFLGAFVAMCFSQIPLSEERVTISNERKVNSEELEFSPVFYKDGIVFISTRFESLIFNVKDKNIGGKNIMSIYHSVRDDEGFLQEPYPLADELIFRYHEGPVSFDRTANVIFFTRNEGVEQAGDGLKKLQVYGAQREEENAPWENIQKLPFNNTEYNYCHPTLSAEEDMLIVSSDIPGGYGGMDLYLVTQVGGKWTQMVNLGDKVNSAGNEVFPYLAADGTLYYSSDGMSGFGGLDIFYSKMNPYSEEWRKPVNLNPPFNSPADDFGFIVDRDNKNGYFSSDRKGGFGGDDIYNFHIEGEGDLPVAVLGNGIEGLVITDEEGNPMEGATIGAIDFKDISLAAENNQVVTLQRGLGQDDFVLDIDSKDLGETAETNTDGTADIPLRPGNYVVKVAKKGYLPQYVVVTPETDLDNMRVVLERAVDCVELTGQVLVENTNTPMSGAEVKIVDTESMEVITVYSDAAGNYEYCISCNRSYSIYAEKNGISSIPSIVTTKGVPCNEANSRIDLPIYIKGASPLYAGMIIRLPNIYFNFDDDRLRPDAYQDLNEVLAMLNQYPDMTLELASHTDSRGKSNYNLNLSRRRSSSVMAYLTGKGISSSRLQPRGYGESQIKNQCENGVVCSEGEHQMNRRTEIKILELGGINAEQPVVNNSTDYSAETVAYADGKGGQDINDTEAPPKTDRTFNTTSESNNSNTSNSAPSRVSSKNSSFIVIAGTFANHDNAVRRAKELTNLGYYDTNIVRQSRSGLYAVYVNTYKKKTEAFALVKKLAKDQLHAYVLRK